MEEIKKGSYFKDNKNRFRLLRYKKDDDLLGRPSITVEEICNKTGLSKGAVSKMEKLDLNKGDIPPCNASTIRAYYDGLDCSYEYLMGNSETKSKEYYDLGSDPILGAFPDSFWDNLKIALTDEWTTDEDNVDLERVTILRLLLSNPDDFKELLDAIFNTLFKVYKYKKAPLPDYLINDSIAQQEYALGRAFVQTLNKNVLPHLSTIYQKHEKDIQRYKENEDKILSDLGKDFINFLNRE